MSRRQDVIDDLCERYALMQVRDSDPPECLEYSEQRIKARMQEDLCLATCLDLLDEHTASKATPAVLEARQAVEQTLSIFFKEVRNATRA